MRATSSGRCAVRQGPVPLAGLTLAGLILAGLLLAPAGGCGAREDPAVRAPDLETSLVLENAAGQATRVFRSGEPITLVVTLRNRAGAPRTITLPTSQTHDGLVYRVGEADDAHRGPGRAEVWRASGDRLFAQVITPLTLAPGEARAFRLTWGQTDARGKPVPPGTYEAVGLVPGGAPGCRSAAVGFTIEPRTAS